MYSQLKPQRQLQLTKKTVVDSVSGVICASVDLALGYTEACSSGDLLQTPKGGATAAKEGSLIGVTVDTSSGLTMLALSGAEEGEEDAAVLDLTVDVS